MTFDTIPAGAAVFLDANTLVYYFTAHPAFGAACRALLERVERKDFEGYVSAHVLNEMAHRVMTFEATSSLGWPHQGIANRLRRHPAEVQALTLYRQAIDETALLNVRVLP